jgi:hypothetical protein
MKEYKFQAKVVLIDVDRINADNRTLSRTRPRRALKRGTHGMVHHDRGDEVVVKFVGLGQPIGVPRNAIRECSAVEYGVCDHAIKTDAMMAEHEIDDERRINQHEVRDFREFRTEGSGTAWVVTVAPVGENIEASVAAFTTESLVRSENGLHVRCFTFRM